MPIKKSSLEKNLFFRIAKVFFLILPLLAAIGAILTGYLDFKTVLQKDIADTLQKNTAYLVFIIFGIILYYVILKIIWRIILYIVFGGLEDDTKKPIAAASSPAATAASRPEMAPEDKKQVGFLIGLLIIIGCIYYAYFVYQSPENNNANIQPKPGSKCIATGCGNLWRCTGTYYVSESQKRVDACFSASNRPSVIYSSWSGTCRQCP